MEGGSYFSQSEFFATNKIISLARLQKELKYVQVDCRSMIFTFNIAEMLLDSRQFNSTNGAKYMTFSFDLKILGYNLLYNVAVSSCTLRCRSL